MAASVANHNGASAAFNRGLVQSPDGLGIATRGVFGHVHNLKPQGAGIFHRVFGGLEQEVIAPILSVAADRAGTDESRRLDGESGLHIGARPRTGSGQPEIKRVDSQRLHKMEDFDFFVYGWIFDRGRLQTVAQGFVIQKHAPRRPEGGFGNIVPVVHQVGVF